jgi:hypothetical protein
VILLQIYYERKKPMEEPKIMSMDDSILHYLRRKKRAGRPKIPDEQKRNKNAVKIYLNDAELDMLKTMTTANGVSDFVRTLIIQEAEKRKSLVT